MKLAINQSLYICILACLGFAAYGAAPELPASGCANLFQSLISFLQDWIDFISGPIAVAMAFFGLVVAAIIWVFAANASVVVFIGLRAAVAGYFLLNIAALLQSVSGITPNC